MIKNKHQYVSSSQAALILGFTPDYIRKLLQHKKIKGEKIGRAWLIKLKNLDKIKRKRFHMKE